MRKFKGTFTTDDKDLIADTIKDHDALLEIGIDYTMTNISADGCSCDYTLTCSGIADDAIVVHGRMMDFALAQEVLLMITTEEISC